MNGNLCTKGHANAAGKRFCVCGFPTAAFLGDEVELPVGAGVAVGATEAPVRPAPPPAAPAPPPVAPLPPPPPPPVAPLPPPAPAPTAAFPQDFVPPRPVDQGWSGDGGDRPPLVGVSFNGPRDQRRLTVAFRWLLALPQFVWSSILVFVAALALCLGWLAALVTGRLPSGIREFVGRTMNQWVGVQAYGVFLMTDRYPPFWPSARDYDVEVELHPATKLNRAAVLFRMILAVPALLLMQLLSTGVSVVMLFVWVVVLVTGRQPRSVFEATAAMLRYLARGYAYVVLLSPTQPRDLLGDERGAASPGSLDLHAAPGREPRISRLLLSRAAKQLVVLTMVIGVVTGVGLQVTNFLGLRQGQQARSGIETSYVQLGAAAQQFGMEAQTCATSSDPSCMQAAISRYAPAIQSFIDELRGTALPQYALGHAQTLEQQGMLVLGDLSSLSAAQTEADFVAAAQRLQNDSLAFDDAYRSLVGVLYFG